MHNVSRALLGFLPKLAILVLLSTATRDLGKMCARARLELRSRNKQSTGTSSDRNERGS